MLTATLCLILCCAVGTGVAFADTRIKHPAGKVYVWLLAIVLLVTLGVIL